MEPLSLKWEFEPVLNLQKFNSIISNIKTTLSKLGDNANVLDEKSLVDIFKKVELQSDKTGKAIKEDFTEAKSAISGISVASKSVDKDFDTLNKGLENTGEVAKNLSKELSKVNSTSSTLATNLTASLGKQKPITFTASIKVDKTDLMKDLKSVEASLDYWVKKYAKTIEIGGDVTEIEKKIKKLKNDKVKIQAELDPGNSFEEVEKKAKSLFGDSFFDKFAKFSLVATGIREIGSAMSAMNEPFVALDRSTQAIKTLGGEAKNLAPTLRSVALEMSKEYPIGAEALQTATYDALSAGIKATEGDISAFMDAAAQLSVGGQESIGNTVNILSSAINAYGEEASKATEYSDILFTTVNLGKTTIPELSSSLSQVVPNAAAMGYSLKDVGAAMSLMTANGIPTTQAATKLNQLLVEMQKPTANLSKAFDGAGISAASLGEKVRSGDVIGAFEDMQMAFDKAGLSATQAFGSTEAAAAFNTLTKDIDKLKDTTSAFDSSAGTTAAAYEEMANSIENKTAALQAKLNTFFIKTTDAMGPFGVGLVTFSNSLSKMTPQLQAMAGLTTIFSGMSKSWQAEDNKLRKYAADTATKLKNVFKSADFSKGSVAGLKSISTSLMTTMIPSLTATAGAQTATGVAAAGMWSAILGPVSLVVGGIAAVGAAFYGLHSLTNSLRGQTAEERLEDVNSEISALESKKKIAQDEILNEEQKQLKIQELKTKLTNLNSLGAEGAVGDEYNKSILELSQLYPGLVSKADSYEQVLKKIEQKETDNIKKINEKKAAYMESEEASTKLNMTKLSTEASKIGEDITKMMTEATSSWVDKSSSWLFGTSVAEEKAIESLNTLKESIYKSMTEDEVNTKIIESQTALWNDPRFSEIPDDVKVKMVEQIKVLGKKQTEALKIANEQVAQNGGKVSDYMPKMDLEEVNAIGKTIRNAIFAPYMLMSAGLKPIIAGIQSVIVPVYEVLRGAALYVGEFMKSIYDLAVNIAWTTIVNLVNSIKEGFNQLYNIIVGSVIRAWNSLTSTMQVVGTKAAPFIATFIIPIKDAFNQIIKVVSGAIKWIKDAWTAVSDFFNMLRNKGKEKVAPLNTDADINDQASEYDKKFKKEAEAIEGGQEVVNEASIKGQKKVTEAVDDAYSEYEKAMKVLSQKKNELNLSLIEDESLKEYQALKDKNTEKIQTYKEQIKQYQKEISKTDSTARKENLQKTIDALNETIKVEESINEQSYDSLYLKLADNRIKDIQALTKTEVDLLKTRKEQLETAVTNSNNLSVAVANISDLKLTDIDIIKKESEIQVLSILSQQEAYKKLNAELEELEIRKKEGENVEVNIDVIKNEIEKYKLMQIETNSQILSITSKANQQIAETNYKYSLQVKENEIKYIASIEEQKREKELLEAEKTYSEKMKKANGYQAEELSAWIEYQETKSKIEREYILNNASVASQTALSFVENLGKSFSEMDFTIDDTSKKETLKKIDDEEKALNQSLKNRTMSYEDYINKLNDLDKQRTEASINMTQQLTKVMLETISKSIDETIKQVDEKLKSSIDNYNTYQNAGIEKDKEINKKKEKLTDANAEDQKRYQDEIERLTKEKVDLINSSEESLQKAYMQTATIAGLQFAQMIADGKSAQKAFVMSALSAAKAMVPIMVVQILGREFIEKGLLGIASAAGLTALLTAAVSAAESAVNSANFKRGAVNIIGPGTETSDSIPARISKGESVIDAKTTKLNLKELQYIWKNQTNVFQYYKDHEPERIKEAYHSIADAKDLIAFAPVIGVMIQDKAKEKNYNTTMLKMRRELKENNEQMKLMNTKLEELSVINSSIEKGNYLRKEHTTVGIDLQLNESELLTRTDRKRLSSLRKL